MMVVAAFDVAIIDLASYATPPRAVGGPLEENVPDLVDQIRGPWCRRHG